MKESKNKKLKIVNSVISYSLGVIAFILIISLLPIPGNFKFLTVLSGSMEPVIKTGSIVLVKPISDYNTNDIITFESRGENVTHRIYEEKTMDNTKSYITKGDANNASDMREVKKENIIGKVFVSIPYLGYGVNFIQGTIHKPFIFLSFVFGLLALVVIKQVNGIRNEIAKNKLEQTNIK